MVAMPSRRSIQPPTQMPGTDKFLPLLGGLTLHSSGWITGQW